MELSTVRKYRRKHKFRRHLTVNNPALMLGVDLPFVVATAFTVKNAAAISIQMLMIHVITMVVARTWVIHLPMRWRAVVNVTISTVMMLISREIVIILFPGIMNSVGVYLYLMAVNGMTLIQANAREGVRGFRSSAFWAISDVAAFAFIMLMVSLIREVFGNATVWGLPLPLATKMSGMQIPFFGFILTGFLLAFLRIGNKQLVAFRLREAALHDAPYIQLEIPPDPIIFDIDTIHDDFLEPETPESESFFNASDTQTQDSIVNDKQCND